MWHSTLEQINQTLYFPLSYNIGHLPILSRLPLTHARPQVLIFSTGKIVCTGGKTKEIMAAAVKKLAREVKEYGVAKAEGEEFDDSTFI